LVEVRRLMVVDYVRDWSGCDPEGDGDLALGAARPASFCAALRLEYALAALLSVRICIAAVSTTTCADRSDWLLLDDRAPLPTLPGVSRVGETRPSEATGRPNRLCLGLEEAAGFV